MAQALNHVADAEKYFKRSGNWANMFNPEQTSFLNITQSDGTVSWVDSGFKGFLQPRYLNGTFGYQDPTLCSPLNGFNDCYLQTTGHEVR